MILPSKQSMNDVPLGMNISGPTSVNSEVVWPATVANFATSDVYLLFLLPRRDTDLDRQRVERTMSKNREKT